MWRIPKLRIDKASAERLSLDGGIAEEPVGRFSVLAEGWLGNSLEPSKRLAVAGNLLQRGRSPVLGMEGLRLQANQAARVSL